MEFIMSLESKKYIRYMKNCKIISNLPDAHGRKLL